MILAGDIGGTHTRLVLFEGKKQVLEEKFSSKEFSGLEEIVERFFQKHPHQIAKACFGIAGPVQNGRCQATNLPWVVDAKSLSQKLKISKVFLINDLEANAYGLNMLKKEEFFSLQEGDRSQKGNQALIAAGTGLGEAALFWNGKEHTPFACEGGHTDFAPRNKLEIDLLIYLQKKYGHVSYERVLSGPGLYEIYQFLIESGRESKNLEIEKAMKGKDPSRVVSEWGRGKKDKAASHAIDLFVSIYGAEAGNLALKMLSLGGLFIGGGIAPLLIDQMKEGSFLASFLDKGRFKKLLSTIPIQIILNDNAALLGAVFYAENKI